jgi:outer membrane biosynthesis protein TonB
MPRKLLPLACFVLTSAVFAAGCGSKRAPSVPDGPPLAMSEPPPRVFAPIEEEEPVASTPVAQETPTPAPRPIPQNRPPARRSTPAESERTEQPAAQTTPVPTPEAPRELRAASAPTDAESERKIGDMLRRANQSLNNVYYQGLSAARKELYDLAKASIKDGEQALKERNFLYAETLADKAAKLATELAGR